MRALILDGYLDEPACLGVPPYLAPYPRYIAGALLDAGAQVKYLSIDHLRRDPQLISQLAKFQLVIFVAGASVPGKYLYTQPASKQEIEQIASRLPGIRILAGPAAKFGFGLGGGALPQPPDPESFDYVLSGDPELFVHQLATDQSDLDPDAKLPRSQIARWAVLGAQIVKDHLDYPHTICEIECYRGCFWRRCSFCAEVLHGPPDFRSPEAIIAEVEALYRAGITRFRLTGPDMFSYLAHPETNQPNPQAILKLYSGIRSVAPELKVLHMDNANPKVISQYPSESIQIAKIMIKYHTPGDVAAFGGETADPEVVKRNQLNADPEDVYQAVKLLNQVGALRGSNGLPELLPGLNFVLGLLGETRNTYELNLEFLKRILDEGLMVRRINIRQVMPLKGTRMGRIGTKIISRHKLLFRSFKLKVRQQIDRPMLRRVIPEYTLLRELRVEAYGQGELSYARQIGSYPILVGIPSKLKLNAFLDAVVCSHGFRSVTGVPYPIKINQWPLKLLIQLPGIGIKRGYRILRSRPFSSVQEFLEILEDPQLRDKLSNLVEI